jgi:hypothetical protein
MNLEFRSIANDLSRFIRPARETGADPLPFLDALSAMLETDYEADRLADIGSDDYSDAAVAS